MSAIVVISWWSNCLGLRCLERLLPRRGAGTVYFIQAGKTADEMAQFRRLSPAAAVELSLPDGAPADHGRVIAHVARVALGGLPGVLFLDHDVFLSGDLGGWLAAIEERLGREGRRLCVPAPAGRLSLTSPAFWLSPARWPAGLSFDPIPFAPRPEARAPGVALSDDLLRLPLKDTLCAAVEALAATGGLATYPTRPGEAEAGGLPAFPAHEHLGGLSLLTLKSVPRGYETWARDVVGRLTRFYQSCPEAWRRAEAAVLLRRLAEIQEALHE